MCRKIVERGMETGKSFRGRTGSCRAAGRASARRGIGGHLRKVQWATKDEYRYRYKPIDMVTNIDTDIDIDITWISLSPN